MESTQLKSAGADRCPFLTEDGHLKPDATMADLNVRANPWPFYEAIRRDSPVYHDPNIDMYLVSRFEDLQKVLADPLTFSVKHGYAEQNAKGFQAEFQEILRTQGGGFFHDGIMTDPPEHTRIRRLLEKAFTAHRVKQLEPDIREIAVNVIEKVADQGHADGAQDISNPFTIRVIAKQLGFHDLDPDKIAQWSLAAVAQIGRMQDREQMLENARLYCEMQNYIIDRIKERQKTPAEDMISDLVHARLDDDQNPTLEFGEIVALGRALLVGGNDTTSTGLTNVLRAVATRPEVAAFLYANYEDDKAMNRFVEEMLRLEPPVHGLSRMTTREVELGGTVLPKGAHMLLLYASGNDDPAQFPCPRDFNPGRGNITRHVTFGNGTHRCVGLALARMEIKVAAQEIGRRLVDIKMAVPIEELTYFPTVATRMVENLPITFKRRA
ncbi:MAG: cytochrome P450 [Sphingobium sp.]|nr:MAG: cytochrome P450 [Sphingobium sp.]